MFAMIAAIIGIVGTLITAWLKAEPERKKEERNEEIQAGRNDILTGNVDAVEYRIDRVLQKTTGGDSAERLGSAEDVAKRISSL